ncbi:hypothetical protein BLA13014_04116 [Burkholderia aenigmatica]|uniref:Uncharacterized protein n=1 Tax=Burkholderia aenigmatica TaxID=2015348 RepID=A0A6P2NB88_9BURK|nr:hypothetical protein BLA13014_04116 [Burkholderia aenigmatica]
MHSIQFFVVGVLAVSVLTLVILIADAIKRIGRDDHHRG